MLYEIYFIDKQPIKKEKEKEKEKGTKIQRNTNLQDPPLRTIYVLANETVL